MLLLVTYIVKYKELKCVPLSIVLGVCLLCGTIFVEIIALQTDSSKLIGHSTPE